MAKRKNNATKQASNRHKVKIDKNNAKAGNGGVIPPEDTRFGAKDANPRHNGAWKKEDTLRFKLQQIAKMTEEELKALLKDETAGLYEKQVARTILSLGSVEPNKRWQILEGITNQDGGYPKQQVEQKNFEIKSILPKREKKCEN